MGIINVTPDSFSDGGCHLDPHKAVAHALKLVEEGAEILDIGGESTRPGADTVAPDDELARILPVIRLLRPLTQVAISVDTRKPSVAKAALDAGADIVNDVEAMRPDSTMLRVVAESGAGYVAMHMKGTPKTMQAAPVYGDVVQEVFGFFGGILERLLAAGGHRDQLVLDPGIGFGKSVQHNLELLARLDDFRRIERPILVGVSRKSFLAGFSGPDALQRLPSAIAASVVAAGLGAGIFRTHDVRATSAALRTAEAIRKAAERVRE